MFYDPIRIGWIDLESVGDDAVPVPASLRLDSRLLITLDRDHFLYSMHPRFFTCLSHPDERRRPRSRLVALVCLINFIHPLLVLVAFVDPYRLVGDMVKFQSLVHLMRVGDIGSPALAWLIRCSFVRA